jgi:hypothetical protein
MRVGVQFTGTVPANGTGRWFTHSWPQGWHVVWYCVPVSPVADGPAQLEWKVQVCRQASGLVKYFIEARNLTGAPVSFQARYAVLNG